MSDRRQNDWAYAIMRRLKPRIIQNYQKGLAPTRVVLLLTTTGRKSGLPRITPLQYEEIDGSYYLGSARGMRADWLRNIQANPAVEVQVGKRNFKARAEVVDDVQRITDYLELRLKRHPLFMGIMLRLEGVPLKMRRSDLERLAAHKSLVVLSPQG